MKDFLNWKPKGREKDTGLYKVATAEHRRSLDIDSISKVVNKLKSFLVLNTRDLLFFHFTFISKCSSVPLPWFFLIPTASSTTHHPTRLQNPTPNPNQRTTNQTPSRRLAQVLSRQVRNHQALNHPNNTDFLDCCQQRNTITTSLTAASKWQTTKPLQNILHVHRKATCQHYYTLSILPNLTMKDLPTRRIWIFQSPLKCLHRISTRPKVRISAPRETA